MHVCCNTVRAVARVMQLMGKLKASKLLTDDVASSTRAGGDVLKYAVIIQVWVINGSWHNIRIIGTERNADRHRRDRCTRHFHRFGDVTALHG